MKVPFQCRAQACCITPNIQYKATLQNPTDPGCCLCTPINPCIIPCPFVLQDAAAEGDGANKKKARRLSPDSESGSSEEGEEEDDSLKKVAAAKGQKGKKRKLKKGGEGRHRG
jgi:hypothetical protein